MEQEGGNHDSGNNGNEETSQNGREGSSERETGQEEKMEGEGEGEAGSGSKEGEAEKEEDATAMDTVQDLFSLSAVNAYGSQEVRKIEDEPNKVYTLTSESHCTSIHIYLLP